MTAINPPGWMQNVSTHTAAQMRTYVGATLSGVFNAGAISRTRGGVHPHLGAQFTVTQNGSPNMSVNVGAGLCFVPGTESTAQGIYICENDATVNLAIATAPGTGLNRIDLVVAQVQDSQYSGVTNAWQLAVVTGTAAASPSAPAAPNDSITICQVFVGANVTSILNGNITDTRFYAGALGGIIKSLSTSRPTNPQLPEFVYDTDIDRISRWNGSAWLGVTPYRQSTTLGSSVASVTFSSIPSNLRYLELLWTVRSDNAVNAQFINLQINGNSGTNYSYEMMQANNTTVTASNGVSNTSGLLGLMVGNSASAGVFSSGYARVLGWDNPHASSIGWNSTTQALGTGTANFFHSTNGGNAAIAGPYTSITFMPQAGNFVSGCEFVLMGWD